MTSVTCGRTGYSLMLITDREWAASGTPPVNRTDLSLWPRVRG